MIPKIFLSIRKFNLNNIKLMTIKNKSEIKKIVMLMLYFLLLNIKVLINIKVIK